MNALPSPVHSSSAADDAAVDPSMEEILASIRRIIADDQAPQQPAARAPAPSPAPASAPAPRREEPRFADLDGLQPRANPARERAPLPRLTIDAPAHSFAPQAPAPQSPPAYAQPPAAAPAQAPAAPSFGREDEPGAALLSPMSDASVASSFEALARTAMLQNSNVMEEAVRDMLRPMLKQWLDDNLPVMVERLVRAEIERVARGGR